MSPLVALCADLRGRLRATLFDAVPPGQPFSICAQVQPSLDTLASSFQLLNSTLSTSRRMRLHEHEQRLYKMPGKDVKAKVKSAVAAADPQTPIAHGRKNFDAWGLPSNLEPVNHEVRASDTQIHDRM